MKPDKDNFHLTYFSDQLPTSLDFHWGDAFSVFFLISGRASYTMEKYTRRLHPGELWLISSHYRPPQPISFGCQPPCKGYLLQIGPEFLHRAAPLIADLTSCFSSGERGCVLVQPDAPTLSCLEEICGKILLCQKEEAFGSGIICLSSANRRQICAGETPYFSESSIRSGSCKITPRPIGLHA